MRPPGRVPAGLLRPTSPMDHNWPLLPRGRTRRQSHALDQTSAGVGPRPDHRPGPRAHVGGGRRGLADAHHHIVGGVAGRPGASASASAAAPAGRDISYPQCGMPLPSEHNARFGVLGVNGGRSFTANPCLVEQLRWAKRLAGPPAFYANTGNPGPWRAAHWPLGQSTPMACVASNPNSLGCSFDYGWNSALHSYALAVAAAQKLHDVSYKNALHRAANVDWWLDVEILNSWQTLDDHPAPGTAERDTMTLVGAVRALWTVGVERVGIYSTRYQFDLITGGPAVTHDWFAKNPVWLAGMEGHEHAQRGCGYRSFTGGPVLLTQYLGSDGFDANVACW